MVRRNYEAFVVPAVEQTPRVKMDDYRPPDDNLSDRSKHVIIITIGQYSPVKDF